MTIHIDSTVLNVTYEGRAMMLVFTEQAVRIHVAGEVFQMLNVGNCWKPTRRDAALVCGMVKHELQQRAAAALDAEEAHEMAQVNDLEFSGHYRGK